MSLIWCTFFGVSLGVRENIHIGVDLLVKKFDPSIQRILIILSILFSILFGVVAAVKGFEFAHFISRSKLLSRDLRIPMEIGMIIPPVGLNLFVASGISGMSLWDVFKGAAPFMIIMLAGLGIITYVPIISLWIPKLIYGALF